MSNILIIKHGSLGDMAQISGVLRDLREAHQNDNIYILTTPTYINLMKQCPYVDKVIADNRKPRWNIFYILKLTSMIKKIDFSKIYDLQNSSRTSFYRKYLFKKIKWSSSETVLNKGEKKSDHDHEPVLERFDFQLRSSGIKTNYSLNPDFSWACKDVSSIIKRHFSNKFILLFPFCSPSLSHKKWPYFNDLIEIIKTKHKNLDIGIAPGPDEVDFAKKINAKLVLNELKALNIMELAGLIKKSTFVISNDTGPAHMTAHLGTNGVTLFGKHTSPYKVSIETKNFRALTVDSIKNLSANQVYQKIKNCLS